MEHEAWMNEQVREEIADLRERFGFEQEEAVACWCLRQAEDLMTDMGGAVIWEEMMQEEETPEQIVALTRNMVWWQSDVGQHFTALYRALGSRVLRRTFPEGWGRERAAGEED